MWQVRTWVKARVVMPGVHRWPDAPSRRSYLATPHPHDFHITVIVAVEDLDREMEFDDMQEYITTTFNEQILFGHTDGGRVDFGARSCETIAAEIAFHLAETQEWNVSAVEVSEDGVCSGFITREYKDDLEVAAKKGGA